MAKYAILIYGDESTYVDVPPEAWKAMMDAHDAFTKAVYDLGGSIAGGEALMPSATATTVREGGAVTDGPFVETKEALGGFYIVEARDLDHALEIAKLCPAYGGGVEVRPVMDPAAGSPEA
jgi:hypothetical protein